MATKQTTFIYMQTKPKRSHSENLKTRPQNKDNVQEEIGNTTGKTQQKPGHQKWRVGMQSNKLKKTESNLKARKENQKKKKKRYQNHFIVSKRLGWMCMAKKLTPTIPQKECIFVF